MADFLLNVLLFVPLGLGLRLLGVRRWVAWTACFALCAWIELMQDFVISGRDSGVNDLIANPVGAAIGIALADHSVTLTAPAPRIARHLTAVAAAIWLAVAVFVQWAMRPSVPEGTYYGQIARVLSHYNVFHGSVVATINGTLIPNHRLSDSASRAVRLGLNSRTRVSVRAVPVAADSAGTAPLLRIVDGVGREIAVVDCANRNLLFRVRVRGEDLRLHPISRVMPHAIPCDGSARGDTVDFAADVSPSSIILSADSPGYHGTLRADPGIALGWRLLIGDTFNRLSRVPTVLTTVWLAVWLVPFGYWLARSRWPASITLGFSAVIVSAALMLVPTVSGAAPAAVAIWITAGASIIGGWCLAWISRAF